VVFDSRQRWERGELIFTADIEKTGTCMIPIFRKGGPIATQVVFEDSTLFEFSGELEKESATG
jgi:hypothetical protein